MTARDQAIERRKSAEAGRREETVKPRLIADENAFRAAGDCELGVAHEAHRLGNALRCLWRKRLARIDAHTFGGDLVRENDLRKKVEGKPNQSDRRKQSVRVADGASGSRLWLCATESNGALQKIDQAVHPLLVYETFASRIKRPGCPVAG